MNYEKLNDIWRRRGLLDKERREVVETRMEEYDVEHRRKLRALQDECAKEIGHNFSQMGIGLMTGLRYCCTACGATKVEKEQP